MKNFRKRLTAVCSAAALALTICGSIPIGSFLPDTSTLTASAAVKTKCEIYSGSNVNGQDYSKWASPIDSYLTVTDSGFMRFQNGAVDDKYLIEYYDKDYNIQETIQLDAELPLFGGFYETEEYYFLLTGDEDYDELKNVNSYRITKYDKDWKRLDSVEMMDCNTSVPFENGSARFAECGKYLLIRTCHRMYADRNGVNHQANMTIQLDMESMEITDSFTDVSNAGYGYVSHSFNQFIHVEDERIIALDHGDANPRSLVLTKYNSDLSDGTFVPESAEQCEAIDIVTFPGSDIYHYNYTGASVGGFEISDTSYIAAYSAENLEDGAVDCGTRNIVVGVVDKETDAVRNIRITDYEEGSASASTPHLIKTGDNSFIVLWSREDNVYYTALDGEGNPDEVHTLENASLSDCVPIVADGELVWYTWNNKINTFYDIDTADLSQHSETVIENGHRMEIAVLPTEPGGNCTLACTGCEETVTFATPSSAELCWAENKVDSYENNLLTALHTGDTLYYYVSQTNHSDGYREYELTCSDPEAVSITPSDERSGMVTFLKEGTYTITATHKYNPAITTSTTYRVNHDRTHTLEVTPAEEGSNLASAACQDCEYTETLRVPTSFDLLWRVSEYLYAHTAQNPYCPVSQTKLLIQINDTEVDNFDFTIESAQPELITFENEQKSYETFEKLSFLKDGETEITVYPTYNPSIKKTVTLKIDHNYTDGICSYCDYECLHDSGYGDLPNCQGPGTCAKCGMTYGESDPENHAAEEVQYKDNSPELTHTVVHACCDAFIKEEPHQFTEESAGLCVLCEYECRHTSGNTKPADCQNANVCNDCGLTFGEIDPDSHMGEDTYFVPDAKNPELHGIMYTCCDTLKNYENHSFALDEETGRYTCACGAQAAWMLTSEAETSYFCEMEAMLAAAKTNPESVLVPLFDMSIDPFVLTDFSCTLDLNGTHLSINSVPEKDYAVMLEETAALYIMDSKGGGEISAPDGVDLITINDSIVEIKNGTLRSKGAVIRNNSVFDVRLYGGTLIGETGIVSENGDIWLYGKPDFQCTGMDFQLGAKATLYLGADLHGAGYTVNRKDTGEFAILAEELTFDDTWFSNQAAHRVFVEENNTIYVRYDLTKAEMQLDQEEYTYSGTAVQPSITGTFEEISLGAADYEIRYTDADGNDAEPAVSGEYRAVLTGIGNFAGTVELPFYITKAVPVLQWQEIITKTFFTDQAAVIQPPKIILAGKDVFEGEIIYSYRRDGSKDAYTEGLPVSVGYYEIMAEIEPFGQYYGAKTESQLYLTIQKAPAPEYEPVRVCYPFTEKGAKTTILPALPENAGEIGNPYMDIHDPDSLLDRSYSFSSDLETLCFYTNRNPCTTFGKSAEITITIPTENYEDIALTTIVTMDQGELRPNDFVFSMEDTAYSGTAKTAVFTPAEGVLGLGDITLTYQNVHGDRIDPVEIGTYYVKAEIDGGLYYHSAVFENPDWTFTITPAIPEIAEPTAKAVVYGQSLADATLTKGWTWADDSIIPTVKNDGFKAIYAVADAENYDYSKVEGFDAKTKTIIRNVKISVSKSDPLVTPLLVGITFTEGEELPEIKLSEQDTAGEIFWITDGTLKGMENILDWRFIPEDAENYNEATGTMVVMAETTTTTTTEATTTTTTTETTTTTTETTTTTTTSETTTTTTTSETTTTTTTTETTTTTTTSETTTTTTTSEATTTTTTTETTTTTTTTETTTTTTTTEATTTTTTSETTTTTTTTETTTTTTTTEATTTTTASETTTTESTTAVVGYTYVVETKAPQFYFSHDKNEFQPEDLIERITRYAVYSDGSTSENGEILEDFDHVDFSEPTPEFIWNGDSYWYSLSVTIEDDFTGQTIEKAVDICVGVKGDANLDGTADAKDAAAILTYAAAAGAGQSTPLYSADDRTMEDLAFYLAEVNTSGDADAKDAALILAYAAAAGSGEPKTWEEILGAA